MSSGLSAWNTIDIVAAVLIIGAVAIGYNRGFIAQLVSIAGLFIAYLAAYWLYDDLSPLIARYFPLERLQSYDRYAFLVEKLNLSVYLYNAAAFAVVFFIVKIGLSIVGRILNLIATLPGLKTINKWSGAALALVEAVIVFAVAVHVMLAIPSDPLQRKLQQSIAAGYVVEQMPELTAKLEQLWNKPPDVNDAG